MKSIWTLPCGSPQGPLNSVSTQNLLAYIPTCTQSPESHCRLLLLLPSTPISAQCHQLCSPNHSRIYSPFPPHCRPQGDSQEVTLTEASELGFLTPHIPSLDTLLVSPTVCRMKSKFFRTTSKAGHGLAPTSLFRSISCASPFLYCPKL